MPTRYLKPGIRDSEAIDRLSPMAEVLFYRLLVTVDDYGRFDARIALIKSQCFPVKESVTIKKCEELILELAQNGLILVYQVEGKPYLQMQKWDNKPRSTESKFPAPADACIQTYTDVCNPHTNLPVTGTGTETKTETKTETALKAPEGVSDQVWQDFKTCRKTLRAAITQSAIDGIKREAEKAGWTLDDALKECCARGWRGFKADWVAEKPKPQDIARMTAPTSNEPDPALAKIEADRKKAAPMPNEIREKIAGLLGKKVANAD